MKFTVTDMGTLEHAMPEVDKDTAWMSLADIKLILSLTFHNRFSTKAGTSIDAARSKVELRTPRHGKTERKSNLHGNAIDVEGEKSFTVDAIPRKSFQSHLPHLYASHRPNLWWTCQIGLPRKR